MDGRVPVAGTIARARRVICDRRRRFQVRRHHHSHHSESAEVWGIVADDGARLCRRPFVIVIDHRIMSQGA